MQVWWVKGHEFNPYRLHYYFFAFILPPDIATHKIITLGADYAGTSPPCIHCLPNISTDFIPLLSRDPCSFVGLGGSDGPNGGANWQQQIPFLVVFFW